MTSGSSSTTNIEEGPSPKLNVQLLMKIQGDRSKKWWNVSTALQVGIIFLSAYSTMTQNLTTLTALFLIPILSVLAPLMRWRADYLKGIISLYFGSLSFLTAWVGQLRLEKEASGY